VKFIIRRISTEYPGQVIYQGHSVNVKVKVTGAKSVSCISCSRVVCLRLKDNLVHNWPGPQGACRICEPVCLFVCLCLFIGFLLFTNISLYLVTIIFSACANAIGGQHDGYLPFWLPAFVKLISLIVILHVSLADGEINILLLS